MLAVFIMISLTMLNLRLSRARLFSDTKIHYKLAYNDLCNLSNKLAALFSVNFD
ncbi:MAG: hypothetical protein JWR54_3098 [Mucilaginibacter sp.]|nr:hypothetical protein [Mucilaginibacter sp.]